MADVAALAGVSSQTVSRVANHRANVDATTREKVLAAMRTLGYRPNTAARALVTGRFGALGVVSFDMGAHGNARTLGAIADAAREADFSVNFMGVRAQTEAAVQQAFQHLMLQSVDGIVLVESQMLDTPSLHLPPTMPVVVADGDAGHRYPNVDFDQALGARSAVTHLLELGHRTVWHLAGPGDSFAARRRAESWRSTLQAVGAPVPPVRHGDWTAESGYRAGRELAGRPDVTAVFAANDQMALGLMRALHEAGRDVPGEVSVVGFDDIAESAFFEPPLTTVHQDFDLVGRHCVTLLLDQIDGRAEGPRRLAVEPALTVRSSTAPPGAGRMV
ncbi:LacI family DNA-binding transcriptional regulator [Streptomyces sp. NBC_01433]|uniref:LacI family DNA-binding transcriptional regulator n=1 Tax=Streptomyces sp. NBC_01433 TaxID=2903864 RepID=UPI00225A08F4|nr:LacI family DNA-binding transcriptional regulator [Streptomyces sp. NBC_01433]MCX4677422.1 LacI family DNA-binding transcriptional regulator [Streptomyces sp. NBC_01433]